MVEPMQKHQTVQNGGKGGGVNLFGVWLKNTASVCRGMGHLQDKDEGKKQEH